MSHAALPGLCLAFIVLRERNLMAMLLGALASGVLGPHPTPDAVMARLKATATDLGAPGYDRRYGSGLIDADRATEPIINPVAGTTSSG